MKTEITHQNTHYNDNDHEAYLREFKERLNEKIELQGKHDGLQNKPKTVQEYWAIILNYIEVKVQEAINYNQQKYLPISGAAAARFIESEANNKENELQNSINDDEQTLQVTVNEAKRLKPDVKLMFIRKWVFVGLIFIALTEGYLSYPPFRHASFPVIAAIVACCAIAFAVGISSHYLGGYIKAAKNTLQMVCRYLLAMIPAIVGFSFLGQLRANAYNHITHFQVNSQTVINTNHSTASATPISVISILLFLVALYLSAKFFRTKAERLQEQEYEEKCKEIYRLEKAIKDKNNEIVKLRYEKITQMVLAGKMFEYALYTEQNLINFAQVVVEAYKQKNLRYRTDGCPPFFSQKPQFNFTRFFDNIKTQKHETVIS